MKRHCGDRELWQQARRSNAGWMLTHKDGQQEQRMSHESDAESFRDLNLCSQTSTGSDSRWDGRGNQHQMHSNRSTALESCPLLCPSSHEGCKPRNTCFNGLVMDQQKKTQTSSMNSQALQHGRDIPVLPQWDLRHWQCSEIMMENINPAYVEISFIHHWQTWPGKENC